jgi:hypothetical protein
VGVAIFAAGAMKAFADKSKLEQKMEWAKSFSASQVRLIGIAEILAGIGLNLPRLVGLAFLTPLAAACLALLMAGAVLTHLRLRDGAGFVPSLVLGALSAAIAVGRF